MDRKNKMTGTGRGRKQRAGQGQAGSSGMGDSDVEERKTVGSAVVPGSPIGKVGRESHHRLTLPPIQHRDHPSSTPSPAAPMNAANDDPYHHYTGQQQPPTPGPYSNTYSSSAAGSGPVPTAAAGPHLAHPYSHPPPPPPYAAHPSAYPPYPHPHQHQHIIYSATPPPHPAASAHHPHHQQHPQHHPQHHPHQHPHQHQVQAQQHHQHPHPHATPNPHYTHAHPGNASASGSPVPGASGSPHPSSSMSISAGGLPPPPPGLVNGGASASVGPVSAPPTTAAGTSASPSVTASGKKRKAPPPEGHSRKKEAKSDNDDIQDLHKKRTKTQRACDSCRTRKIRCDVLTETDPPHCQHCKQYGFECTFFLPITETRFKKKRLEEEAAAAQQNAMAQARDSMRLAGPSGASAGRASVGHAEKQGEREMSETASSPRVPEQPKGEVKVFGPTSMAHLLHSTATVPQRLYHSYDQRHNHVWEVGKTGDGFITVIEPRSHNHNSNNDDSAGGSPVPSGPSHHTISNNNGNKESGGSLSILTSLTTTLPRPVERDVLEKLINTYFQDVAPLVPIITASEFLASASSNGSNPTTSSSSVLDTNAASPPPILLYSICLVAAAKRQVPQAIFDSLRSTVNNLIKSEDVLSTASLVHVQALLILCQCGDCHGGFVPSALSAMWVRLGAAIRMAQDLGLHRSESFGGTGVGAASRGGVQMRRRLWAACVVTDRWVSLSYGHPYMIDVADCDTRFPSSGDPNDRYNDELVRLSLILGRVQKTIYTPSGITHATDEKLNELLSDMKGWKERLPDELKFRGSDTPREGGILHLLYSCVSMIFWRVFMRISYSVPEHLKFGMTVDTWTELVRMTGESIEWLNEERNEGYYDVWLLVSYAATSCALVQYHTWVRRKDAEAQNRLRMLRDCVRRWEASLQPEHMSSRRKTAEIITLLYEATLGPPPTIDEPPVLNPTGGVRAKLPASFKGLVFKKDPSRPGGGVFVARGTSRNGDYANIPEGVIVVGGEEHEHEEEGVGETGGESAVREKAGKEEEGEGGEDVGMGEVGEGEGAGVVQTMSSHDTSPQLNNGPALGTPSSIHPTSASAPSGMVSFAPLSGNPSPFTSSGAPPTTTTPTTAPPTTHHQQHQQQTAGGGPPNLNPSLNDPMMQVPDVVQVMNVLDTPQGQMTLAQCVADNGLLEGIPGSMFDWPQWDSFFARFASSGQEGQFVGVNGQQQQQHQHQQQQQQQQQQHQH